MGDPITTTLLVGSLVAGGLSAAKSASDSKKAEKQASSLQEQQAQQQQQQMDAFKAEDAKRNVRATATGDQAAAIAKKRAQAGNGGTGNRSTILTSPLGGVTNTNPVAKTLLGQ